MWTESAHFLLSHLSVRVSSSGQMPQRPLLEQLVVSPGKFSLCPVTVRSTSAQGLLACVSAKTAIGELDGPLHQGEDSRIWELARRRELCATPTGYWL